MARSQKFTPDMQVAAVRSALSEGKSLEQIKAAYPNLKDGIAIVEKESAATTPPSSRTGSGARAPLTSMMTRPTL